jgi:RNA polymerase sigma-70 factor (ECF subfamily)
MNPPPRADSAAPAAPSAPGDPAVLDHLIPGVYGDLCAIAHRTLRGRASDTLQTTALVHETYLKLLEERRSSWNDRSHLLGVAATAMRRILIHSIEAKRRLKRVGAYGRVPLTDQVLTTSGPSPELLAIDEALGRLASFDPRKARLVELRFFAGLSMAEAARLLGVSEITAKRDWAAAKLWILREISPAPGPRARRS